MSINDKKKAALRHLGKSGAMSDMFKENTYWKEQTGGSVTGDAKKTALIAAGYSGTVNDMEAKYWKIVSERPSSTKWRMRITANNGGVLCYISDVHLRGGAGQAMATPVTASADTTYVGLNPSSVLDGLSNTSWSPNGTTGILELTFTVPQVITHYRVNVPSSQTTQTPKDWVLEYWNGSAWIVAHTVVGAYYGIYKGFEYSIY